MFSFNKTKRIFKDICLQEQFEREGFVVVEFYSPEQVNHILDVYLKLHPQSEAGFFASTYSADRHYREAVHSEITAVGQLRFDELFMDYQIINGCFIVKSPGESSYLHIHQDMTLVDEQEFTGINIWTTTVDLTEENGVLYLLPGSHRFFPTYRGHTLPGFYDSIQEEIKDYMEPLYLKSGQAVIFDQSIIHFSLPNLSDNPRIVTNVFFTHQDSRFRICYHDKNNIAWKNKVEIFEQDVTFMTQNEQFAKNIYDRPTIGKSLGLVDYDFPVLTIDALENRFGKKRLRTYTPTKKLMNQNTIEISINEHQPSKSFWEKYTPLNILREVKYRITGH